MLNGSHLENRQFYLCSVGHTTRSFIFFSMENAVVAALLFIFYCTCINPFHSRRIRRLHLLIFLEVFMSVIEQISVDS